MSAKSPVRVLCVDDEPNVIEGLSLQLRRGHEITGASGGEAGLAALRDKGPFAVVLSDMRMPGMDGAAFLSRAREVCPDTTRVLLTGHADLTAAISAVNHGGVFRFLTKPCPPDVLRLTVEAAAEQHRLVTAERVLLEQTLRGSVRALTDILELTAPAVFGRASRVRRHALELADEVALADRWALEVAAMLSQLGAITVPEEVLARDERGEPLGVDEQQMLDRAAAATTRFLAHIPRLEAVRDLLAACGLAPKEPHGTPSGGASLAASVLKVAHDFEALEGRGESPQRALDLMRGGGAHYDARVIDALGRRVGLGAAQEEIREVLVRGLWEGMVLAEDVRTTSGVLLVARGFAVTASFIERVRNFGPGYVREPLRVLVREPANG